VRLRQICVFAGLALGISPSAVFAATVNRHTRATHHSGGTTHHSTRRNRSASVHTADDQTGGSSAGSYSGQGSQPSQQASSQPGSQPSDGSSGSPGAPQGNPGGGSPSETGGQAYGLPNPAVAQTVPGAVAKLLPDGSAAAPADAPPQVQQAIWAANKIIGLPYVYGGGHSAFAASGYDCSGTVSYALHGASLIKSPLDSSEFMSWGQRGKGQWITVYTNPGHAYAVFAGLRLDTSSAGDPSGGRGPRWRPTLRSSRGYRVRHPVGF
jgi:cell wall-associated NlpC family hydrolase